MKIYTIRHKESGKEYIGQTKENPNRHWIEYKSRLRKNRFHNAHLQNAWNKYGEDAFEFEIVDGTAKTQDYLNELEIKYIKERGYYNILAGGDNRTDENRKIISERTKLAMTSEIREKISRAMTGKKPWNVGLKYDCPTLSGDNNPSKRPEVKKKMSDNHANFYGEKNPNSKLRNNDIQKMIILRTEHNFTYQRIADMFNISKTHARKICNKESFIINGF